MLNSEKKLQNMTLNRTYSTNAEIKIECKMFSPDYITWSYLCQLGMLIIAGCQHTKSTGAGDCSFFIF